MKVRPLLKNPDEYNDPPRPFFEHIVALRACLMHAGFAWAVSCIVAGCFSPTILRWLKAPADALVKAGRIEIVSLNITGGFSQIMSIALWGGTVISFPFVMYFALRFIFPALTKREKVAILFFLIAGTVFFGFGVGFAFGQLAPNVVSFFDLVNEWVGLSVTQVQVEDYVWRKFAIVIAFFLGMVLTPPDPMSQIVMALPLCILYEVSIWAVWLKEACSGERWRRAGEAK